MSPDLGEVVTVCITPTLPDNPYQMLLTGALEDAGAEVVTSPRPSVRGILAARRGRDILNLHWPEFVIGSNSRRRFADAKTLVKSLRLLGTLRLAKRRRVRVVWIVHNLIPHEARRPRLDLAVNRRIAKLADTVVVHSYYAAERVEDLYRLQDVQVASHGNYVGYYPRPRRSRAQVRSDLGVPLDAHVILAFGTVREYKQLPQLVEAFRSLPDPRLTLVIAGFPITKVVADEVTRAARGDSRVRLLLRRIEDAEVLEIHAPADVAVLAYRDIFSSGALLLALSCGLPTIVPRETAAGELGGPPAILSFGQGELADAMVKSIDITAASAEEASRLAMAQTWDGLATLILGKARVI